MAEYPQKPPFKVQMRHIHFGSQITHLEVSTKTNHPLNRTLVTPDGNRFEASLELESEKSRINESCRVTLKVKQLAGFEDGKACYSYLYLTEDSVGRIDLNQTLLDHETLIINLPEEVTSYAQIEIKN